MSIAARLNSCTTQLAVGRHLRHRTVRLRLTLLYGGLFLLSGAALVAITYVLFQQATEYTKPHLPDIPHTPAIQQVQLPQLPRFLPQLTEDQYLLTQDQHQLAAGLAVPGLAYSVPLLARDKQQLARDQHQLAQAVDQLAGAVHQVAQAGSVQAAQRAADSHQLLVNSGIALAIMAVLPYSPSWPAGSSPGASCNRWRTPTGRSASSSPTPHTSCARR